MHAALTRRVLFPARRRLVDEKARLYEEMQEPAVIAFHQVQRFNTMWHYCLNEVPFYARWAREHGLPRDISHPDELADFPTLTKREFVENAAEIFQHGRIRDAYSTGGTTGTPTRYPRGPQDVLGIYAGLYAARSWSGIRPFDRYVHLWGHSHLFGQGRAHRAIALIKRHLADRIVNGVRIDAYDLTEEAMASHLKALINAQPDYLVGYTSAVFKLARYIERRGLEPLQLARLRHVVLTAETVTDADASLIRRVFNADVVVEYGAAELGIVAESRGATWPLHVLWDSHIVHVAADDGSLRITTLEPRKFPLVNYAVGDQADAPAGHALILNRVTGRIQDAVQVATTSGAPLALSAILPVHILKSRDGVLSVQFRQVGTNQLEILLHADRELDLAEVAKYFARELRRDHHEFDPQSTVFRQIDAPILSRAGKHLLLVD